MEPFVWGESAPYRGGSNHRLSAVIAHAPFPCFVLETCRHQRPDR